MTPGDETRATLEALLDTVARDRDRRCQELTDEATDRATALLAEARSRARRTVTEAVASERRRDREAYRLISEGAVGAVKFMNLVEYRRDWAKQSKDPEEDRHIYRYYMVNRFPYECSIRA